MKFTNYNYFLLLDHLELYIKVRLNTRPSYQRQQKFGRGPVVHKTRVLRGTSNPQWREDFMVGMNLNQAFCCYGNMNPRRCL